mmetsp:Transcript_21302/g.27510  ORF Transcript_21302/g.27510 Transcript_21302/m.27510 type:complete len:294 (+) Transcript_21302:92-973(+)|eukprot:CAMPEP_0198139704 /NCGR_PEP_ID=MMETSP1443-20131203/2962_1 /TAXON_ID=186043 /ORGANISM="Entomoneis sp., Strain CCMP2396" /LENGTH=293 /DNA_ID=CAMNT_0043801907 /DNA_START=75 /DNA_END=956 /DNA_ORIENTATION=+
MTEPDDLYTLRAQFWLGHYQMAIEEAKSIARRPMPPNLKAEREEFLSRSLIASGQQEKATAMTDTPALQALALKAQFELAVGSEEAQTLLVDQLKSLAMSNPIPSIQLTTAQVLLAAGQTKEALQQVYLGATMDHISMILQIYLKLDRLDLAKQQYNMLRQADEDAILTQLAQVYTSLASGSTGAADALHALNSLTEQYGASPLLLNLTAVGLMSQGDFAGAQSKLEECLRDFSEVVMIPDTLINLITCTVQQNKSADELVSQMKDQFPAHSFCAGLDRVVSAFERESIKYRV